MLDDGRIAPVAEADATGRVKEIFEEIKQIRNLEEVPLIFRIMAHIPMYLETSWERIRFALEKDGRLEKRTKWMVALAISASNNNKPMILESTERLKALAVSDQEIAELMAVVDVTNGLNKTLKAAQVNFGE